MGRTVGIGYQDFEKLRMRNNSTFKANPYLERAVMTGITRISKESIFSDLNNLKVVTTTSDEYAESFGFTEEEVFDALDEFGMSERKEDVKEWYDGFTFGNKTDIYNPWSIINYLDTVKSALNQIEAKAYETALILKGIPAERIRKYGFAFCGKRVLIGTDRP